MSNGNILSSTKELLKQLVAIDTTNPPGNEEELARYIAGLLEPEGFDCRIVPCGEGRASLVATIRQGEGGKRVVFNGHLDVVPAGEGWSSPPFTPHERNGRLYGRGTADMKGGVAAMVTAAVRWKNNPKNTAGELVLQFVADEELVNLGTRSTMEFARGADCAVIGEPTEMQLHVAHRGTARYRITCLGRSCHSSMPQNGVNAIEMASHAVLAFSQHNRELSRITHPVLPSPTLACTIISAGQKDNIIPDECVLSIDRRIIPGDTEASVEAEIRGVLDKVAEQVPRFRYDMERYIFLGSGEVPLDSQLVGNAVHAWKQCFPGEPQVRDFPATCEQTLFTDGGIPAIVAGPGSIDQAHIRDEFVELDQLEQADRFYEAFLRHTLGT